MGSGFGRPKLKVRVINIVDLMKLQPRTTIIDPDLVEWNYGEYEGLRWEERSHAQHREHGEHRTFPAVSTVAGWPPVGFYLWRWRCLLCLRR
jgi:broad specificity phosphatase PhoE